VNTDGTAPTSSASAPATSSNIIISVSYTAADNPGGSGLGSVELWAKGPGAATYTKAATDSSGSTSGSFTYGAAGDGSYAFYTIAVDKSGNRENAPASADATTSVDSTRPTAFTMADPGQVLRGNITLTLSSAPTDSGSGMASVSYQFRRSGATTWSTACTTTALPWSCKWNTLGSGTPDGSYDLQAVAADRVGNTTVASNAPLSRVVDNAKPVAQSIATSNVGTKGKPETGDSVTFTYTETLRPGSILSGWSGAATAVRVSIQDNKKGDQLTVLNSTGSTQLPIADPLALGGDYVGSNGVVFNATMVQNGAAIQVTLSSTVSGGVNNSAVSGGTLSWSAATGATDLAGNAVARGSVSASGPAF